MPHPLTPFSRAHAPSPQLSESYPTHGSISQICNFLDQYITESSHQRPRHIFVGEDSNENLMQDDELVDPWYWIQLMSLEIEDRKKSSFDTKAVLDKCQREVYKLNSRGSVSSVEQENCPICLEKFMVNETLFCVPCKHKFHMDCLKPWIKSHHGCCPICRADILAKTKTPGPTITSSRETTQVRTLTNAINTATSRRGGSEMVRTIPITNHRDIIPGRYHRDANDLMSPLAAIEVAMYRMGYHS